MISRALAAASTRPMILAILQDGENYGYQIIQRVKDLSGGTIEWSDGMLYPVLHRLEKENLILSCWKMSQGGRHRKYYTLTVQGKESLVKDMQEWLNVHRVLTSLWDPSLMGRFQPSGG
ncbi:MAG: helix-turn-helix transcriptional regulator [Candidatus Aminicenantes bacterium]|nr:MAG: helix-turn-helix transcriptional regulator [Candidatus Aminicenantes bacterium]